MHDSSLLDGFVLILGTLFLGLVMIMIVSCSIGICFAIGVLAISFIGVSCNQLPFFLTPCAVFVGLFRRAFLFVLVRNNPPRYLPPTSQSLLFAFYIYYDIRDVLDRDNIYQEDHIFAALQIYLDIINMFFLCLMCLANCAAGGDGSTSSS